MRGKRSRLRVASFAVVAMFAVGTAAPAVAIPKTVRGPSVLALTGSALERHALGADPLTANVAIAWTYLVTNTSLGRVQIAGLLGNLLYESGGALDPAQVQFGCQLPPGPCGVGIAQWTDPGSRFNGLVSLAKSNHVKWSTLAVQLQYVWQELRHTPSFGLAALKACTTLSCATRVVETEYERPANQSKICSDPNASYCRRLADADEILIQFGTARSGYWMLGADGAIYPFGSASNSGAASGFAAAITTRPDGRGFWVVDQSGKVWPFGEAAGYHGGSPVLRAGEVVSTISATPSGNGYWLFTNRGRAFVFGDARFYGDMSGAALNGPIVASVATPTGHGYYMVGSDGGVFSFGDARFHGSTGGLRLNRPVVGIAPTPDNRGYWLVASDGGVFAFAAPFRGSMGGTHLNRAVNGLVAYGNGYLMVASDGGVFDFSNKAFLGSLPPSLPSAPIIGIAAFTII